MKDNINLLVLSPGFPCNEEDTTCLVTLQMFVRELQSTGLFRINVVSLHYPFERHTYNWFRITVHALGGKNKKGISRLVTFTRAWFRLNRLHNKSEKTVVLSFLATDAAFVAGYFSKWKKLKHFCWMIGQDTQKNNHYINLISRETIFMAISEFSKQNAESNFKIKIPVVLHNGLNLSLVPVYEKTEKVHDFICVGSLIKLKRVDWVINLVNDLKKENIQVNCLIVGDGVERSGLQKMIDGFNLNDRIKLTGELPNPETIRLMFMSRFLIHPSGFEGFSTVCLEGLYAACHIVTTISPFPQTQEQVHLVKNYQEMFLTCKALLKSDLRFKSISDYTTARSVEKFIQLL